MVATYFADAIKGAIQSFRGQKGVVAVAGDSNLYQDTNSGYLQGIEKGCHTNGPGLFGSLLLPCVISNATYRANLNGVHSENNQTFSSDFGTYPHSYESSLVPQGIMASEWLHIADDTTLTVATNRQRQIAQMSNPAADSVSIFEPGDAWTHQTFHLAQNDEGGIIYTTAHGDSTTNIRVAGTAESTNRVDQSAKIGELLCYELAIPADGAWGSDRLEVDLYRWNDSSQGAPQGPVTVIYNRFVNPSASAGVSFAPLLALGGNNTRNLIESLIRTSPQALARWMQACMWELPQDSYFMFMDLMTGNDHADTTASFNPDTFAFDGAAGQEPEGFANNALGVRHLIRSAWELTGRPRDKLVFTKGPYHDRPSIAEGDTSNWVMGGVQQDWSTALTRVSDHYAQVLEDRGITDTCILNGAEVCPYVQTGATGDELTDTDFNASGTDYAHLDRVGFEKYGRQTWRVLNAIANDSSNVEVGIDLDTADATLKIDERLKRRLQREF